MVIASRLICRIPTWYQLKSCFYSEFKHHHDSGSFPSKHIGTSEAEQRFMLEKIGHSSRESFLKSVFQWRKLAEFTSESVVSKETVKNGGSVEIEGTYVVLDSSKDACSLPLIGLSEQEMELEQQHLASLNTGATYKSFLGQGYYNTYMPAIIRRAILENPRWYTSYTPYQPEISQGRLEMLFYYQRMISSLTELPIANASLLDEGSAACEAMLMAFRSYSTQERKTRFLIDNSIHPQVENVLKGRADSLKITLERFDLSSTLTNLNATKFDDCFGVYFQYPNTFGELPDFKMLKSWIPKIQCLSIAVIAGTDPLALCLLKTPGWLGVDISVGSVQRFGLPMGNGGPHAAFIACKNKYLRKLPGRLVGRQRINEMTSAESSPESKADAENLQQEQSFVYRLSLQTREQHIRRERATSNICTAQVLPANLAVAFAMYHGPTGLVKIAKRVEQYAATLLKWLKKVSNSGHSVKFIEAPFFDTIWIEIPWAYEFQQDLIGKKILIRRLGNRVIIALDEMTTLSDIQLIMTSFKSLCRLDYPKFCHLPESLHSDLCLEISKSLNYRIDSILSDKIFNTLQSEVSFSRYLYSLGEKDYSLVDGIIPLGSCTMKLNSVVQLLPLSMKGFMNIHPFLNTEFCELTHIQAGSSGASTRADVDNPLDSFTKGYSIMNREFMAILKELTGMYAGTLQPNSGSQGELLGISLIRAYFKDKIGNEASTDGRITSNSSRTKCLIPVTAHGTNPASAILSG